MTALIHRVTAARWRREGAACDRYRCDGTLHLVRERVSAVPMDRAVVALPSPTDYPGVEPGGWVGTWACSSCSARGPVRRADIGPAAPRGGR